MAFDLGWGLGDFSAAKEYAKRVRDLGDLDFQLASSFAHLIGKLAMRPDARTTPKNFCGWRSEKTRRWLGSGECWPHSWPRRVALMRRSKWSPKQCVTCQTIRG